MTVSDDLAVLIEAALAGAAANAGPSDVSTGDYASRVEHAGKAVEAEFARLERENEHLHLRIQRKNERLNAAEDCRAR